MYAKSELEELLRRMERYPESFKSEAAAYDEGGDKMEGTAYVYGVEADSAEWSILMAGLRALIAKAELQQTTVVES